MHSALSDRGALNLWNKLKLAALRWRKKPRRETDIYPRLVSIGTAGRMDKKRPAIKGTATNLRYFSRTVHARRAINAIKNPISQLGWEVAPIPGVKMSRELERRAEIAASCLDHPNADDSFRTLIEQVIEDYLGVGAGAIEQQLGAEENRPLWLWPVDGQSIRIFPGWSGERNEARYLQVLGYGNIGMEQGVPLLNDELIYIRANPSTATPYGYGPLEIAFNTISRKLGVADFAGNMATNARPQNMLYFEGADKGWVDAFRSFWRNEIEAQGVVPIVGGNSEAKVLALHGGNDDALYLKYQEFLIREIATAFDLSPQNLGVERDINRNTSETAEDRDWDQAIKPLANLIAEHLTREALHGKLGFYQLQFRFVGIDREDEKATAEIYEKYYKNNAITPNEQRERLGLPPLVSEWGDMTAADVEIAISAARGAKKIEDPALTKTPAGKPATLSEEE